MRKSVKRALGLGLLAGVALAVYRAWRTRVPAGPRDIEWSSAPFPFPPIPRPGTSHTEPAPAPAPTGVPDAVEPNDDGSCPLSHPVKGKLSSGIYHVPGGANYERTHADRCYVDEEAALGDDLRRSKV